MDKVNYIARDAPASPLKTSTMSSFSVPVTKTVGSINRATVVDSGVLSELGDGVARCVTVLVV